MRKSRYSEEQIIGILREAEGRSGTVEDYCRGKGITPVTFYRWKAAYGGMAVNEVARLRELERENARLKKIVAEKELSIEVLKEINAKKW